MIIPDISLELLLWSKGLQHIAGVDEAGKGPLAGPVTAGAVMIHEQSQVVPLVRDSKLMTAKQREEAFEEISKKSSGIGIGIVEANEIDAIGIDQAVKKAMLMALKNLEKTTGISLSHVLVDGSKTIPLQEYPSQRIKKGGLYHYSISAGSVLAKVTRDRIMKKIADDFPLYGFEQHVGYGTSDHLKMLIKYGPCAIHRKTFEPVKSYLTGSTV